MSTAARTLDKFNSRRGPSTRINMRSVKTFAFTAHALSPTRIFSAELQKVVLRPGKHPLCREHLKRLGTFWRSEASFDPLAGGTTMVSSRKGLPRCPCRPASGPELEPRPGATTKAVEGDGSNDLGCGPFLDGQALSPEVSTDVFPGLPLAVQRFGALSIRTPPRPGNCAALSSWDTPYMGPAGDASISTSFSGTFVEQETFLLRDTGGLGLFGEFSTQVRSSLEAVAGEARISSTCTHGKGPISKDKPRQLVGLKPDYVAALEEMMSRTSRRCGGPLYCRVGECHCGPDLDMCLWILTVSRTLPVNMPLSDRRHSCPTVRAVVCA
ncbi:hypothetical protein OH77DRAFT_1247959 [Trametes cingulata]|nr:hypothetical protein OH77DRAFT_1247959 [Trametes cingulata]